MIDLDDYIRCLEIQKATSEDWDEQDEVNLQKWYEMRETIRQIRQLSRTLESQG